MGGFNRVLYCKFKFGVQDSKRCVSPLRQRLAVVKWYRVDAEDRKSFVNEAEVKTSKRLKMAEAIMVYIGIDALSLIHD